MKVHKRTDVLCGKSRPGHFDGVVTVLTKLFHLVQPNKVYFGKKDAQQVAVVDGLVNDLNFPLQIVAVDTVREHDGLAKSSRNVYLTEEERAEAPALYHSLQRGVELIKAGEENPESRDFFHCRHDSCRNKWRNRLCKLVIIPQSGNNQID